MANYRYTYDYNGRRYEIDAPKGSTAADLQRIVQGSSRGNPPVDNRRPAQTAAPVSSRQATQVAAQQQIKKKREEERGFFGELYDSVFGSDNTTPKALTETQQTARITDIAAERQRLLTLADSLDAQAKATLKDIGRGGPEKAQYLSERAKATRASAASLGNQAAFITKTGVEAPKPSFVREVVGAAPREFTRGVVSLPGVIEEFTGRGLSMVGAPGGEYLTKTGQADQAAASKLAADIFGAPSEDLQYDSTTQLATDVSGGLGSMATFAIPGGAARLAGAGKGLQGTARAQAIAKASLPGQYGIATVQGAGQGAEDIRAYEQRTGEKVSDATAFATMLLNAGLGATEVGVFNKLVERIPVAQRGAVMEKIAETVRRVSKGKVDPTAVAKAVGRELTEIQATGLGRIAVRGGAEAAQEGGVQLGTNLIAQQLYDEDRKAMENVGYSALVGGIVGGGVRGGVEATQKLLGSTPAAGAPPPPPPSSRATATPPADMGPLAEALGPVGGKITLQDAFGPQEYTFEGFDKKGKVVLTDVDGVTLSEDPDWVQNAIKSGIVESEEGLGGMAFGMDIEEDVAAPPPPPPPPPPAAGIGSNKPKFTIETLEEEAAQEAAPAPILYHGGRSGLTLDDLQIVREPGATKQGRKGRVYGGFYATENESEAIVYANMAGEGNTVYEVQLRPDAVVENIEGDITRLSPQKIDEYRARGVDVVVGKDVRGRTEHVVINKDAVTGLVDTNAAPKPKFTIEMPPPSPRNTQGRSQVGIADWDLQNRSNRSETLFEGDVTTRQTRAQAVADYGNRAVHGLSKAGTATQAYNDVVNILENGINPERGGGALYTGPLDATTNSGAGVGTASGTAYFDGPFALVGRDGHVGQFTSADQIAGILVNDALADTNAVEDLRQRFPNLAVETYSNAGNLLAQTQAAPPPPPPPPPPAAPRAVGKAARVTIPVNRQKFDVQYELQDLDNIKFAEDELQNRDRSRPASDAFVTDTVNNFDPEGLGEDRYTDRGAPIINKDNTILSGNGRTQVLQEIYGFHPDKAEIYKESLREQGYDIEGIERPVLVRRLMSDADERKFVTASNESDIAALSPPEQAAQDASDILTPGVFAKFKGGDLGAAKNDAFVSAFLAEMSPQQRKNAMDDKGKISAQGLKRIENALLYKAYGGTGRASKIFISKAMERNDDDTKTLTNALVDVSKDWIQFQQAIEAGEVDKKYDITNKLMETIGTASDIKASGNSVGFELRSPDMVNPMDPFVREILLAFHNDDVSRILSKKAIADKLRAYAEVAANQQPEPDMFGMSETPSAREIWKRIDSGEGAPQSDLYADQEQTRKSAEGSIIGGTEVDIDAFRGKTLDDLLNHIASNNDGNYSAFDARLADRLNQLLSELQKAGAKVTLHIVQKGDAAPSSIAVGNARGLTDADLRTRKVDVYLRSPTVGNGGNSTEIILHEALHAVSGGSLLAVANGRGTPEMVKFRKELNDLRNKVITHFNGRIKSLGKGGITEFERSMYSGQSNAFKDLDEFLTWGLTNKMAQDYLRSIEVGPKKSLFTKFVDAFRSLLNISPKDTSALAHLVDVINPLFETTAEDYMTTFTQEGPSEQKQSMQAEEDFDTEAIAEPTPAKLSRVRQSVNRLRTSATWSNIASQFSGARAVDNWLARSYGLESLPETDSFYSNFETYLSKKNGKLQQLRRKYVDPIDDAVGDAIKNGVTMDDINDAIQARGAAERNAAIAEINEDMPDGGSGLTNAEADAKLRELQASGKMRYINRVVRLHDRLRDETQRIMVQDGLVSAETMAEWKKKYPNYTPYKGWAPAGDMAVDGQEDPHADYGAYEKGAPVYSRVGGLGAKPVKAAKGRSSQAANSLYNMIADAEMFLEMGQKNQIYLQLDKTYQSDPEAFEGLLKIYDKNNPKIVKGKAVKITDESAHKNGVRGFKNGEPFIIETAPNEEGKAVRRAFTNLDPSQLDKWLGGFYKVMGVMRGLHTRFNAAFWPREFLRSISDAVGNVYTEKGRKRSAAYGKSAAMKTWKYSWDPATQAGVFAHLINRDAGSGRIAHVKALTEEMIVNGGAAGQEFAERAERVAKRMEAELKRMTATGVKAGYFETKAGFAKLIKVVDGINDFVDIVPRVAAYRALTEAGLSPKDAAQIALRSTLDMSKRGRFGRLIDSGFWWTTPSITNLTKKVTGLDSSTYRKLVLAQLSIGFALGMLNIMNAPDSDDDGEDDYSQLPEWRKLAYLHVYYSPDEKPFTMPVGFLFLFERYVGGKMAEVLAGQISDGNAAVDIMTASQDVGAAFLASLSPVVRSTEARTLAPSSIAPIWDLNLNESFFKTPIYNEPFDDSEAQASRVKPTTPEVYKIIAKGLQEATRGYGRIPGDIDVSPDQIKYFVDQYAGGVGRLVSGAAEGDIEAVKKLNPFYFDPKLVEYSPMGSFYERDPEMKRAIAADKLADEGDSSERDFLENTNPVSVDSGVISAFKDAQKELKDLRKDANDMDPDEYRAEQLRIMSEFNRAYNDAKKGNYSYTSSADEDEEDTFIPEEEEGDE